MPQLDLVTFVDQSVYVYIFFIFQYTIISVFIVPGIYQIFALKRLVFESALLDIKNNLMLLTNTLILVDLLESDFEFKIG